MVDRTLKSYYQLTTGDPDPELATTTTTTKRAGGGGIDCKLEVILKVIFPSEGIINILVLPAHVERWGAWVSLYISVKLPIIKIRSSRAVEVQSWDCVRALDVLIVSYMPRCYACSEAVLVDW